MLFETLKQSYLFLGSLYFGLISGIIKEIFIFFINLFNKNKIIKFILDLIYMIILSLIFILCLNIVNYGEFRIYLLISFILGYFIERKSLGFLVDFIIKKLYNFINLLVKKINKLKIFKRINLNESKYRKKINKNR